MKNFLSSKWPSANPNPKVNPRVRVGVNSWESEKRWEFETKFKNINIVLNVQGKIFKSFVDDKFLIFEVTLS